MKIIIAGDFAACHRIAAQIDKGDFSCLDEVKPFTQSVDYSIINFESPVVVHEAIPIDKTGPNLRCSEKAMECIAQAGFGCVTLANNHFRDYGQVGVEDTLTSCRKFGVDYVGGGKDLAEAQRILYKEINGKRLAVINVCENEWSIADVKKGGSNPLNIVSVCHAIHEAKHKVDYVLLIIHGGTELYNLPTPRMKETYRFFIEQGADAVVNHHQHCYSGYEIHEGKPIFYGLGNFCFDEIKAIDNESWKKGYMVELVFGDTIEFLLHPYIQCSKENPVVEFVRDRREFDDSIQRLNQIIADDAEIQRRFGQMASKGATIANNILTPYNSAFLKRLSRKKVLPSFLSNFRLKQLLGHVQCESHRDVLLYGLNNNTKQ